jgi:hypothetical protein
VIHFRIEKAVSGEVEFVDANCPTEKWPKLRRTAFFLLSWIRPIIHSIIYVDATLLRKRSNLAFMFRSAPVGGSHPVRTIEIKDNTLQKYCMTCQTHLGQLQYLVA